jgi:hypothetical protein
MNSSYQLGRIGNCPGFIVSLAKIQNNINVYVRLLQNLTQKSIQINVLSAPSFVLRWVLILKFQAIKEKIVIENLNGKVRLASDSGLKLIFRDEAHLRQG